MLPTRSRLTGWNPDSLATGAASIKHVGQAIYRAVWQLDDGCDGMDEARTWQGTAHSAATDMFKRAVDRASHYQDYTAVVAKALRNGSATIGTARTDLLREADAIDRTELSVSDNWVVQIRPAAMTAEHASELQKRAQTAQGEVNGLLTAVGNADDETSRALVVARASEGWVRRSPDGAARPHPARPR